MTGRDSTGLISSTADGKSADFFTSTSTGTQSLSSVLSPAASSSEATRIYLAISWNADLRIAHSQTLRFGNRALSGVSSQHALPV
jgi:hypothetical protein